MAQQPPSSLSTINEILGKEATPMETLDDGTRICKIELFPALDLTLERVVLIEFVVRNDADSGRDVLTVKCEDSDAFRLCRYYDKEKYTFSFPWMDENRWYPLSVWFFLVRNTLVIDTLPPWHTPETARVKFPIHPIKSSDTEMVSDFICGTGRMKGRRPYMEDTDIAFNNISINDKASVSLFGVFDGHGGGECSAMIADELPTKITTNLCNHTPPAESVYNAFIDTDKEFLNAFRSSAGSTANLLLWDPGTYMGYLANSGDTRSVICRDGIAVDITRDQKATDPDEMARIAKAGGYVQNGRVMGILAVARAFGDASLKQGSAPKAVTVEPEITTFRPLPEDEFIIMATDGLWDVMSSQVAVDFVVQKLQEANLDVEALKKGYVDRVNVDNVKSSLNDIADWMATKAYNMGSQDNITVSIMYMSRCGLGSMTKMSNTSRTIADGTSLINGRRSRGEDYSGDYSENTDADRDEYEGKRRPQQKRDGDVFTSMPSQGEYDHGNVRSGVNLNPSQPAPKPIIQDRFMEPEASNFTTKTVHETSLPKQESDDLMDFLLDDSNF